MGRAIVRSPQVFLMDEPLSNLDAKLRVSTRTQIAALQRRLQVTTVYVTHDQSEALTMGDRVAVLKDGVLQQVAPPREMYERPANAFVAGFIGSPAMNLFPAACTETGVKVGTALIPVRRTVGPASRSGLVTAGFRPESLQVVGPGQGFEVTVNVVEELGSDAFVYASFEGGDAVATGHDLVVRIDPRSVPAKGETLHLQVREDELHLFDIDSGARLA
jgi:multiple sugar transport system ATP-binding protein